MLNSVVKAGLVVAAVTASALSVTSAATAGGIYDGRGSIKDVPMMRPQPAAGPCYVRGDVGYSVSSNPSAEINSPLYTEVDTDDVSMDGGFMGEIGIGCGSGSRGFRADLTLGYRGERDIDGFKTDRPGFHYPGTFSTKVSSLTAMANVYYDLGKFRSLVPYIGVGIGVARHKMSDVSFALSNDGSLPGPIGPAPSNDLSGSTKTNFAWSLMAGAAYQISHRAVLDFGYRYIDMGDVSSRRGNICTTSCGAGSQDKLEVNDMSAHEFKIGLRYHFGGKRQAPSYK
jgi:opacity protein-like surface antigen